MVHIYNPTMFAKCRDETEHSTNSNSVNSGEIEGVEGKI